MRLTTPLIEYGIFHNTGFDSLVLLFCGGVFLHSLSLALMFFILSALVFVFVPVLYHDPGGMLFHFPMYCVCGLNNNDPI